MEPCRQVTEVAAACHASRLLCWRQAARETDPTPVVTRSSDVSRVESTSSMVHRSRIRGGCSSAALRDVEVRPEIEFRQEPEIDNPAKIQVSMSAICQEVRAPLD